MTILERFKHLGLAHNKSILSWCGEKVADDFCRKNYIGRDLKEQEESGETFKVWNYPDFYWKEMDAVILATINRGQNG